MFKENQYVIVKPNFFNITPTRGLGINDVMREYAGKEYKIRLTNYKNVPTRYKLYDDEYNWIWDENWLEPVPDFKECSTEELDLLFKGDSDCK